MPKKKPTECPRCGRDERCFILRPTLSDILYNESVFMKYRRYCICGKWIKDAEKETE